MINNIINKIGKPNFILIVFIIFIIFVTGLYTTFSLYTSSSDLIVIDGVTTYKFIINSNNSSTVNIPANSEKNIAITVSNTENIRIKYGLYYSTTSDLKDVTIGVMDSSDYKGTDILEGNKDGIVTIKIYNDSNNDIILDFGLKYGLETGGDLNLDSNKTFVKHLEFERFNLNEAEVGSYISYTGDNGCEGESCNGKNANYVDDDNMGYCHKDTDRFTNTGFRLAYVKDLSPYIISAGSPECTSLEGNINLDNLALKYCNPKYIYGSTCSDFNVWNMNTNDFKNMFNTNLYYNTIDDNSCFESTENKTCGYENDLLDNGSWYWISDEAGITALSYSWNPFNRYITYGNIDESYGIRPILRLDTNILVTGGKGTSKEPYIIKNTEIYSDNE